MKQSILKILIGICIGVFMTLGTVLYFAPEKETIGIRVETASPDQAIALISKHIDSNGISTNFPYSEIVSRLTFPAPIDILEILDTINAKKPNDTLSNITLLHQILADSTFVCDSSRWKTYNADAAWEAIHWVDLLQAAEQSPGLNPNAQLLFQALRMSWMDFITNHLTQSVQTDWRIKHQATFVMLNLECQKRNYNLALGYSKLEKGILRLSNNEFAYILKRIHGQLGVIILLSLLLGMPLFIYGLYRIARHHWPSKKRMR
jgi:hypothetical protein